MNTILKEHKIRMAKIIWLGLESKGAYTSEFVEVLNYNQERLIEMFGEPIKEVGAEPDSIADYLTGCLRLQGYLVVAETPIPLKFNEDGTIADEKWAFCEQQLFYVHDLKPMLIGSNANPMVEWRRMVVDAAKTNPWGWVKVVQRKASKKTGEKITELVGDSLDFLKE